jgi:AcrR family transcriptional regulator
MNEAVPDQPGSSNPGVSSTNVGGGSSSTEGGPGNGSSTRRRILDIALALMSQRGVDGTSMRDLASAAGLNVASLYHYFPSKRELLESVLVEHGFLPLAVTAPARSAPARSAPASEPDRAAAAPSPAAASPAAQSPAAPSPAAPSPAAQPGGESDLAGLIEGILKSMFQVEDFVRLMVGEAMRSEETARSVGLELFSTFEDSIEAWVRTHRPDLDERAGAAEVARLISAMVIGIFIQHAAGALPNEGDDLAALIVARAVEAARVISPS